MHILITNYKLLPLNQSSFLGFQLCINYSVNCRQSIERFSRFNSFPSVVKYDIFIIIYLS